MPNIQQSTLVFHGFINAAKENKAVVLDRDEIKSAPAAIGAWGRFVIWIYGGESTRIINVDTRQAFMKSISNSFGPDIAELCRKELKFNPKIRRELSGREIKKVYCLIVSAKATDTKIKEIKMYQKFLNRRVIAYNHWLDHIVPVVNVHKWKFENLDNIKKVHKNALIFENSIIKIESDINDLELKLEKFISYQKNVKAENPFGE